MGGAADPALGIVELSSIARGVVVADAMVKRAPVRLLQNHPFSSGKHLIVLAGGVAEVYEAMAEAAAVAAALLVDKLFLPQVHEQLPPLIAGGTVKKARAIDAVAVVELTTVASTILAADAAAKAADVMLLELRLGQGIGGKGYFTMTGTLDSIEAAAAAGRAAVDDGLVVGVELIASPHEDLRSKLIW